MAGAARSKLDAIVTPTHHLLSAQYSDTRAVTPRAEYPFPLAEEVVRVLVRPELRERLAVWTRGYVLRGPPWQEVLELDLDAERPVVLLERFVGLTFADVVRNLSNERWILPLPAWRTIAGQLIEAARRAGEQWLREPPCPAGIGWSLTGELMLAPVALNTIWATNRDVLDHTVCFTPEHLGGESLSERTIVYQVAVLLGWMAGGEHPLGPVGEHLLAFAQGPLRPPVWKRALPLELAPVLERALEGKPGDRFASLDAFESALVAAFPAAVAPPRDLFSILEGVTHRLVDRLVAELWAHDHLLPATWDGLWPATLHPLEGLAVVEDGLLERRVDRRSLQRWPERAPTTTSWVRLEDRLKLLDEVRKVDARRWWSLDVG